MILTKNEIESTLKELLKHPETEWVEFKEAKIPLTSINLANIFLPSVMKLI